MSEETTETTALVLMHKVDELQVVDQPTFTAGEALRATVRAAKATEMAPVTAQKTRRYEEYKKVQLLEKRIGEEYTAIEGKLKGKLLTYSQEQKRKAAEQERLAEDQRRKAEAEERRREADAAAARQRIEDERLATAARLEKEGDQVAAEAVLAAPVEVAPVAPPPPVAAPPPIATPKVKNSRMNWSCVVDDMPAFIQGCRDKAGSLSEACLIPDMKILGGLVRLQKDKFSAPGVRVICEER